MALPDPVLYPPFDIVRLGYVRLSVTDLAASHAFYADILGLHVSKKTSTEIFFRGMEERGHHCLHLCQETQASAQAIGFKTYSEEDLDKAKSLFEAKDFSCQWVEREHLGRVLQVRDCHGMPLEFYHKMEGLPSIHQQYKLYRGVKPLRIDHVNSFSTNVDESVAFYNDLGFRTTEYTQDNESKKLWAAWMHRKGGVHDVAFTNGEGPRLHHTAFWVPTPLNIIDLLDVMSTTGYLKNIERGPGRHGISNAFFLYIRDPDGHRIEIYCSDYQTIDPDHEPIKWDLTDPQRQTLWGAPAPRSWFEEGTNFEGVTPDQPTMKAKPIIAPW